MSEFDQGSQEEALDLLREGLRESDEVPSNVGDFAKALFTWRTIEADLAEIAYDSIEEGLPAGVRSTALARMVSFQAGRWNVDLEYDEATGILMGRVSPESTFNVELHSRGAHFSVDSDDASRFEFEGVSTGPISLVFRFAEGGSVKTSWVIL
jgi:hypothetical protein